MHDAIDLHKVQPIAAIANQVKNLQIRKALGRPLPVHDLSFQIRIRQLVKSDKVVLLGFCADTGEGIVEHVNNVFVFDFKTFDDLVFAESEFLVSLNQSFDFEDTFEGKFFVACCHEYDLSEAFVVDFF